MAVIARGELGCEKNIGKVVEVSGLIRRSKTKGPQWLIRAASPRITRYITRTAPSTEITKVTGVRFSLGIDHPDAWMVPITGKDGWARRAVKREAKTVRTASHRAYRATPSPVSAPAVGEARP